MCRVRRQYILCGHGKPYPSNESDMLRYLDRSPSSKEVSTTKKHMIRHTGSNGVVDNALFKVAVVDR